MKDLVILVADLDAENAVRGLLSRPESLGTRPITYDMIRHLGRDAGCRKGCVDFLRLYQRTHRHAMVLFDLHGSGMEQESPRSLEAKIEKELSNSGWGERAVVIVLDPEVEAWVWSDSPHVVEILGWRSREELNDFLIKNKWLTPGGVKPEKPKESMEAAMRKSRKPRSAALFRQLAETVGLRSCQDSSFLKFRDTLQAWFGADEAVIPEVTLPPENG